MDPSCHKFNIVIVTGITIYFWSCLTDFQKGNRISETLAFREADECGTYLPGLSIIITGVP